MGAFLVQLSLEELLSGKFSTNKQNFNVASFPGLFNSWEQQRGFFQNSPKGKEIWGELTKKTNSTLVMYNPVGPVMTFSC